ncbi:MAG: hypothetical protein MUW55_11115 [Pantoea vagans]|nr:hypothetical protein [Pantoea vagans]
MYFPDNSELEKGMEIIYSHLVKEVQEQNQKSIERKQKLQADATNLVQQLKKWLYLPEHDYVGDDERQHPWVDVYIKNQAGNFERRPPQGLQTDRHHVLNFYIGLLIAGEGLSAGWLYVPVEMYYQSGSLHVISGNERAHVKVMHGTDSGRLYEAATLIKNSFMKTIKDPNLA